MPEQDRERAIEEEAGQDLFTRLTEEVLVDEGCLNRLGHRYTYDTLKLRPNGIDDEGWLMICLRHEIRKYIEENLRWLDPIDPVKKIVKGLDRGAIDSIITKLICQNNTLLKKIEAKHQELLQKFKK